jgi:hypothetical protein
MRLSDEQLWVIKEVRSLMHPENLYAPRYICQAIGIVLSARIVKGELSEAEAMTLKHTLATGVLGGISNMVSLGGFLLRSCPPIKEVYMRDLSAYRDLVMVARRTWLDWIIETGEIKPDLLAGDE